MKIIKTIIFVLILSANVLSQNNTVTVVTQANPIDSTISYTRNEISQITYEEMLAKTANLTDADLGMAVYVTDLTHSFPAYPSCNKSAETVEVIGVWVFEKKSTINQCDYVGAEGIEWRRLKDGRSSMPCAICDNE